MPPQVLYANGQLLYFVISDANSDTTLIEYQPCRGLLVVPIDRLYRVLCILESFGMEE
jgi:hypothetical protein